MSKLWKIKTRWISSLAADIVYQETEKKPTQGSQDIKSAGQGNVQQGSSKANASSRSAEKKPA